MINAFQVARFDNNEQSIMRAIVDGHSYVFKKYNGHQFGVDFGSSEHSLVLHWNVCIHGNVHAYTLDEQSISKAQGKTHTRTHILLVLSL